MKIRVDRGKIVKANYGIISFIYRNLEVFDQLLDSKFSIERVSENTWFGKRYKIKAKVELINHKEKNREGTFNAIMTLYKFGISNSFTIEVSYSAAKIDQTAVHGLVEISSSGIVGLVFRSIYKRLQNLADELVDGVKIAGEMIHSDFETALGKLSDESRALVNRKSEEGMFNLPLGDSTEKPFPPPKDYIELLQKRVGDLEKRLNRELTELKKSFDIFSIDPALALAGIRKIIEAFARKLLIANTKIVPGTQSLGTIIDLLNKEAKEIPTSIIKSMRVVCEYGNLGIHVDPEKKTRSIIGRDDFEISLSAALKVVEWYFSNYD